MQDHIFDIEFTYNGLSYKGWVNPSDKLNSEGKPVSFHVVLNDTSFGYLAYQGTKWNVNEERPLELVEKIGRQIETHYNNYESHVTDRPSSD